MPASSRRAAVSSGRTFRFRGSNRRGGPLDPEVALLFDTFNDPRSLLLAVLASGEHGHADESADYILAALRGEEVEELDLDAFAELMQVHQRGDLSMHALKQVTRRVAELLAERGTADAAAPSAADDDGWTVKGSGGRAAAQQPTNGSSTTKSNGGHHSRNGSSGSGGSPAPVAIPLPYKTAAPAAAPAPLLPSVSAADVAMLRELMPSASEAACAHALRQCGGAREEAVEMLFNRDLADLEKEASRR